MLNPREHKLTRMTKKLLSLFIFLLSFESINAQQIPEGYILQYEQNFSAARALNDFRFSNPHSWGIFRNNNNFFLQFRGDTLAQPFISSPGIICVLNNLMFGDFIMEVDLMPLKSTSRMNEVCIFLAIKDTLKYYYIQLSNQAVENSNGIFLVNNAPFRPVTAKVSATLEWTENKWHKVRIVRSIIDRSIKVYTGNMTSPLMETRDNELVAGYVGFGSFAGAGCIDNLRIWAPAVINGTTSIFKSAETK